MKIRKNVIELLMAEQGISVAVLSGKTGISSVGISRIKNGLQNPRPATIGKIARALNVPVENLIEE